MKDYSTLQEIESLSELFWKLSGKYGLFFIKSILPSLEISAGKNPLALENIKIIKNLTLHIEKTTKKFNTEILNNQMLSLRKYFDEKSQEEFQVIYNNLINNNLKEALPKLKHLFESIISDIFTVHYNKHSKLKPIIEYINPEEFIEIKKNTINRFLDCYRSDSYEDKDSNLPGKIGKIKKFNLIVNVLLEDTQSIFNCKFLEIHEISENFKLELAVQAYLYFLCETFICTAKKNIRNK